MSRDRNGRLKWPWARSQRLALDDLPLEGRVTYAMFRIGDRWFATFCENRGEAAGVAQWLHDQGAEYTFAGQAANAECGHWQLRKALGLFGGGGPGPLPWTWFPKSAGGGGVNVQLLRASFEDAVNSDGELVRHFYERLFRERPDLRRYFPRQIDGQVRKLGETLTELMLHLEEPDYLRTHLPALGQRHKGYGVKAEHFLPVVNALIETLREACGGWGEQDADLVQEWTGLLVSAASLMGYPQEDVLQTA
jgi:hemoglobin-like flavoprotein